MRHCKCLLLFLIITCKLSNGQNLVPNGDFEQYSSCPLTVSQIDYALYWINPSIPFTGGSPDYYNSCSSNFLINVPNNWSGFQNAHSGNAYAGIYSWQLINANAREYIEIQLLTTLKNNTCYHFEMYVNLGDVFKFTTDAIGAYFSDTIVNGIPNGIPLPFNPQINNTAGNFFDTLNWTLVKGDFTAHGGEKYLIIGNFKDDSSSNILLIDSLAPYDQIYCFVDDVSLIECNLTGLNEFTLENKINIFFNTLRSELNIKSNQANNFEIILYDFLSRNVRQENFIGSAILNIAYLEKGVYIYEIRDNTGTVKSGKIFKE